MDNSKAIFIKAYGLTEEILRNPPKLTAWCEFYGLSLLHLAVIVGEDEQLEQILNAGANPNAQDRHFWTPLHHAALLDKKAMIQMLLTHGANPYLKNNFNGTYQDILAITHLTPKNDLDKIPVWAKKNHRKKQLIAKEYESLTSSHYIDEPYLDPKRMIEFWKLERSSIPRIFSKFDEDPKIGAENLILASASDHFPEVGLGVFAKRDYAPFETIGEYVGIIQNEKSNYSATFTNLPNEVLNLNAKEYGNAISRVNDGFPNANMRLKGDSRGLPGRLILVALEHIKKGEQICYNYGHHPVKLGPYIELRPAELRKFIKKYELRDLRATNAQEVLFGQATLLDYQISEKFKYLICTPSVVFTCILDGSISFDKGKEIMEYAIEEELISPKKSAYCHSLMTIAQDLLKKPHMISYALLSICKQPLELLIEKLSGIE